MRMLSLGISQFLVLNHTASNMLPAGISSEKHPKICVVLLMASS